MLGVQEKVVHSKGNFYDLLFLRTSKIYSFSLMQDKIQINRTFFTGINTKTKCFDEEGLSGFSEKRKISDHSHIFKDFDRKIAF